MKPRRYIWLACLFLALSGCETEDECSEAADCDDLNFCTEDRCRLGRCSYLGIPGCCHTDQDCGPSFGPRCKPETDRCEECLEDADCSSSEIGPRCDPNSNSCVKCLADGDCGSDEKCDPNSNSCVECLADGDCGSGEKCDPIKHECIAPRPGEPCANDSDCNTNWCLTEAESGYPGGFCGRECQTYEDCESYACVDVPGGQMSCLPVCFGDPDCRPEYMCMPTAPDRGACFPHCTKNEDCPAAGTCNPWLGLCIGDVPGGENGAPCLTDADCKGFCAKEADTGAPGGVCISICSPSKIACPEANEACVWQLSPYLESINVCLPVFNPQDGCRPEYAPLVAVEFLIGEEPQPVGVCQPACRNDADCSPGLCNRYSGLCGDLETGAEHGAACVTHEQCKGLCLNFWPDGYCTGPCHLAAPDCPGDSGCIDLVIMAGCIKNCQTDPDCRPGYFCEQTVFKCVPPS